MTHSQTHTNDRAVAESKDCWRRIQLDDKRGLEDLYSLFAHEMMAFGLSIVPDRNLVKDCIQELFIEIWRYRRNGTVVKNVNYDVSLSRNVDGQVGSRHRVLNKRQGYAQFP